MNHLMLNTIKYYLRLWKNMLKTTLFVFDSFTYHIIEVKINTYNLNDKSSF